MHTRYVTACLMGAVSLMLLIGPACSKKEIQATSGSKSSERPIAKAGRADSGTAARTEPGISEQDLLKPGKDPSAENLQGDIPGDIKVAKVQPSDSTSRIAEDIRREQVATAASGLKDVFFAFDSWNITEEARQALSSDAEWIKANPNSMLKIEGHCDERGTQAYNLVLGEKRAKAVRNYLAELGVVANRLAVVSYGKERPFCKERDELCYQQNRRGHIVVRTK
ncbi:MAG: peptidoglycan-associated lipoprotein Pal [Nitrospirae bacterium]|nr:MAG: peptidoglycan-associated lipoprotein Pal [Nitrospirota bacterium]